MDLKENLYSSFENKVADDLLRSFSEENVHAFWFNEEKISKEELLKEYPYLKEHPLIPNAFIYDKNQYDLGKSLYQTLGAIYIQDPSAMMPAYILSHYPGSFILDCSASPGGKSLLSSYYLKNNGYIISNDLSFPRCKELLKNVERMGSRNITVTNNDFLTLKTSLKFEKIILDAPCSGSGMFRKDQEMLKDWSTNKVLKFSNIQKEMILKAFDHLVDGGYLLYSTCSYSKEEDEEVVDYLLNNRDDAHLIKLENITGSYYKKDYKGLYFLPCYFKGEGQFLSLIKKGDAQIIEKRIFNTFLTSKEELDELPKSIIDNVCYLTNYPVNLKGFNVLRTGLKYYEIKGKDKIYQYHASHTLKSFPKMYDLSFEELKRYLKGETLSSTLKGFILLTYKEKIALSFGKANGAIIKNHFPIGLRVNLK